MKKLLSCLFALIVVGCGGTSSGGGGGGSSSYTLGGTVSGLAANTSVVLVNKVNGNNVTVNANESFVFSTKLAANTLYDVRVETQPDGQICTVSHGTGTINGNVSNVKVLCAGIAFVKSTLGGTESGLNSGESVTLTSNGQDLTITQDGPFKFEQPLVDGSYYDVRVKTQPNGQVCTVSNESGVIMSNVTNVVVTCKTAIYFGTVNGFVYNNNTVLGAGPIDSTGFISSLAVDTNGNVYAANYDTNTTNSSVFQFANESWGQLGASFQDGATNYIAVDAMGNIYSANAGSVYQYTASGWNILGNPVVFNGAISSIAATANINVYVGIAGGAEAGSVFQYTNESGWTQVSGGPIANNLNVNSVITSSVAGLFAGTSATDLSSTSVFAPNYGHPWNQLGHAPIVTGTNLTLSSIATNDRADADFRMYAAINDGNSGTGSVYELGSGPSWTSLGSPVSGAVITSIVVDSNNNVYAGVWNHNDSTGGVWEYLNSTHSWINTNYGNGNGVVSIAIAK